MIKASTTDPECGVFHKGEHKKVFAYSANTACDKNNFILDFVLSPGNNDDPHHRAQHGDGSQGEHRITSYKVCYTKLLR